MSTDDDNSHPSIPGIPGDGRELRVDGRITGETPRQGPVSSPPVRPGRPARASSEHKPIDELVTGELELDRRLDFGELAPRPPPAPYVAPGPYRAEVPKSRLKPALLVLGLVGLGVAALFFNARHPDWTKELPVDLRKLAPKSASRKGTLLVMSDPSGATVTIAEQVVGVTPWSGDNVWTGQVKISLSLPNHRTWTNTLRGGETTEFDIRLTPSK